MPADRSCGPQLLGAPILDPAPDARRSVRRSGTAGRSVACARRQCLGPRACESDNSSSGLPGITRVAPARKLLGTLTSAAYGSVRRFKHCRQASGPEVGVARDARSAVPRCRSSREISVRMLAKSAVRLGEGPVRSLSFRRITGGGASAASDDIPATRYALDTHGSSHRSPLRGRVHGKHGARVRIRPRPGCTRRAPLRGHGRRSFRSAERLTAGVTCA